MEALRLLAFGWTPSGFELIVILVLALLLFGKRLPEVAKGLGKGIVEFKKGVRGIEDEVDNAQYSQGESESRRQTTYTPPPSEASSDTSRPEEAGSVGNGPRNT